MANEHVRDPRDHFPKPEPEQNMLHRPMNCNMTYWGGNDLKTCIMARILMTLVTVEPKHQTVFGRDQIPKEHGGGPWYAAARACFPPARVEHSSRLRHVEVVVKGQTQLSKTQETTCQAYFCFFAEGVLPSIMVRNKGGANVGTADMHNAVREMNEDIMNIFDSIKDMYEHLPEFGHVNKTDFILTPRCTSAPPNSGKSVEWLDIHGHGNYALKYPQVLISCTNVQGIKRLTETISGKGLGSNMGMSLMDLLSGGRHTGDKADANPHAPYIWDVDDIPTHPQAAIALLFDEDDANRSSTGSEKTDSLLFTHCPALMHGIKDMMERMRNEEADLREEWADLVDSDDNETVLGLKWCRIGTKEPSEGRELANPKLRLALSEKMEFSKKEWDEFGIADLRPGDYVWWGDSYFKPAGAGEDVRDEDDVGGNGAVDRQQEKFYKEFKFGVRSRVARVYAYTATPITVLHDMDSKASQIVCRMIELQPGRNYVGYATEHSKKKWPWLKRHVEIRELPNRVRRESFPLKAMYPEIIRLYYDPSFKDGDMIPSPFRTSQKTGTVSLSKKDQDQQLPYIKPGGNPETPIHITAGELKEQAVKAVKANAVHMSRFWYEDGVNLVHMLRDMHEKQEEYSQGYRNSLYMSNFTKTEKDQAHVVERVLALDGESEELVNDLICMEFTYKHVRFSWKAGAKVDGDCLFESAKSLMREYEDDPIGFSFGDRIKRNAAEDGEISILESDVPNINWGYTVLWTYMTRMRERDPSFFLKVLTLAGEIGARGVRYKSAKKHMFVLTDMFYAFAVSSTQQVCAHGTGVLQAIGRLCSMVVQIEECPKIQLWMPKDCWALTQLWMDCFDSLPDLINHSNHKQELEMEHGRSYSYGEELKLVTQDPDSNFGHIAKMLICPTGHKKNGQALYARPDHMLGPSKRRSEQLANDPKCVPRGPLQLCVQQPEMRANMMKLCAQRAFEGERESGVASSVAALPPVAPGEKSIPEPQRLDRPPVDRDDRKRKTSTPECDHNGRRYMLKSPISDDARDSMTTEEKEIEKTLYHEKDHFDNPASIALRRAVIYVLQKQMAEGIGEDNMVDASEEVWFTKDGDNGTICRDSLLKDQATLIRAPQPGEWSLVKKDGFERGDGRDNFDPARACNKAGGGNAKGNWQKKGDRTWAMFEFAGLVDRHTFGGVEQTVMISKPVLRFVEKFNAEISKDLPLESFSDMRDWCIARKLIGQQSSLPEDEAASGQSGAGVNARSIGPRPAKRNGDWFGSLAGVFMCACVCICAHVCACVRVVFM
eukprot:Tamp_01004.p1 GENE.Tamp_01004~~Tamp_01004.p1  ORF type:complete len:1284 (+),score=217.63 Tamp_01004:1257-5108(+)